MEKSFADIDNPEKSVSGYKEINHNKFNLLYVSVGLVLGVFVCLLLVLPTKLNSANKENRELQLTHSEEIAKKNVSISNLEKQIDDLEKQIAAAEKVKTEEKDKKKAEDSAFEIIKKTIAGLTYENLCAEAGSAVNERRYADAIDICNAALQIKQGEMAYYYLGKAYIGNQEEEKAKAAFISLKDNYPESTYMEEIMEYLSE